MAKNHHVGGGALTQNQNNEMSDDPRDGSRNSFTLKGEGEGPESPKYRAQGQDEERLAELGKQGSKQDRPDTD